MRKFDTKFGLTAGLVFLLASLPFSGISNAAGYSPVQTPPGSASQIANAGCVAKANQIAAGYPNAQIMSVQDNGYSCTIVIRIPGTNGNPPRIVSKTVSG